MLSIPLQSDQINELTTALVEVQKELKAISKDASNPFFKSKYATLQACIEGSRDALTKHGLAISQTTSADADSSYLITSLMHTSGQYIRGIYQLTPVKNDPQSLGSAMTYARRYAYAAIVGLVQDDDDGEAAQTTYRTQKTYAPSVTQKASFTAKPVDPNAATPKQKELITRYIEERKVDPNIWAMTPNMTKQEASEIINIANIGAI